MCLSWPWTYRREWNWPFTSNGQSEEAPPWRNGWHTSNQNLTIWWLSEPMNRVNQSNSLSHHSSFLFIVSHDKHCTSQYTTHFHEKLNESAKQIKILHCTEPTPEKFGCGFSTNRSLSHNLLITCKLHTTQSVIQSAIPHWFLLLHHFQKLAHSKQCATHTIKTHLLLHLKTDDQKPSQRSYTTHTIKYQPKQREKNVKFYMYTNVNESKSSPNERKTWQPEAYIYMAEASSGVLKCIFSSTTPHRKKHILIKIANAICSTKALTTTTVRSFPGMFDFIFSETKQADAEPATIMMIQRKNSIGTTKRNWK